MFRRRGRTGHSRNWRRGGRARSNQGPI